MNVDMDEVNPTADQIHCPPDEIDAIEDHFNRRRVEFTVLRMRFIPSAIT